MTNLSFFTKYPTQGATSRYRSYAFAAKLAELNYNIEIDSLMPIDYLQNLFENHQRQKGPLILSYFKRVLAAMRTKNNLIIERELLPYIPYSIEKLLLSNKRYILDFDDNVWEDYRGKALLEGKYDQLVKHASGIIVGNDFLANYIGQFNQKVIKIPTVINLDLYQNNRDKRKFERFSLVWIGSPITYRYIREFAPIFQELAREIEYDLIIIASQNLKKEKIDGVSMKFYDWSAETEIELLSCSHVGIMPLTDDPFSKGKSGFKLIQYQAAGLPSVASPVGENCQIIQEGFNGFLPFDSQSWIRSIKTLHDDRQLYHHHAENSKKNGYNYSIQKYFPIYKHFIDTVFKDIS